ncbi:MAG: hypothetical protein JWR21_2597 [Herminiimonas sp.]|nr:hypothetical protein [Herminiimonas sp.]
MRDDLHKTVPLSRIWSRVLRHVSQSRLGPLELGQDIVWAVRREALSPFDEGVAALCRAMRETRSDLFDDGEERLRLALVEILNQSISANARAACEMAVGILLEQGVSPAFEKEVIQTIGRQYALDRIEHMAAKVSQHADYRQARSVKRALLRALAKCDFTEPPQLGGRRLVKTDESLFATDLCLVL